MAIIDSYKNSTLGLKGETPKVKVSATAGSPNIVFDPTPGSQGDEVYNVKSELDLDGKTPGILPSALKSSATHVFDPDFSIGQASDPLLNLRGQALAIAQRNRRGNNAITYDSVLDLDGKTPNKSIDNPRSENVKSTIGLDGKTPPTYRDNAPEDARF